MQPLVKAEELTLSFGPTHVLRNAGFLIHPGDKIALVGPNGAGKTTLFRILAGQLKPDLGTIEWLHPDLRVQYLPQVPDIPPETPVADILVAATPAALRLEREIRDAEAWMADPAAWEAPDANERMTRYSELQGRLAEEKSKGRALDSPLLNDLGVPEEALAANFGSLSGGERSKVLLAKTMSSAKETDLLLLDEPTNHMDIPTVEFFEELLAGLPGAVIVSAHDRYLLDLVAERVFEVDHKRIASYTGDYTSYRGQREALARAIDARRSRDENEVKRQLRIIEELKVRNKFDAQIRSRRIRMQKMAKEEAMAPSKNRSFRLFFEAGTTPRECIRVEGLAKSFGERTLFSGVEFEIEGGDRVGVVGPNGCGKSTLLELLIGRQRPDAGRVERKPGVTIGYFDQHHQTLQGARTLIDEARSMREPPPPDDWSRGLLGRFHFSGDEVYKKVSELSGGERARLALAKFIVGRNNTLILDEPTNHLDLESQEVVAAALREYEGTVIVVSHNRNFLDRICTKTLVIAHRRARLFPGGYSTAAELPQYQDFAKSGAQGRYKVLRAFRDWERDAKFRAGETITVTGLETQAFRRLLRWAESEGRIEMVA